MYAQALRSVPEANSSWYDDFVRQHNVVDINIAVQTPLGLMIPIVRNADDKGLTDISADVKSLAKKVIFIQCCTFESLLSSKGTWVNSSLLCQQLIQFLIPLLLKCSKVYGYVA